MDRILSARVDEGVVALLEALARKLGRSKKAVLEDAVRCLAQRTEGGAGLDVLEETFGAWQRTESAAAVVRRVRGAFRGSLGRRAPGRSR